MKFSLDAVIETVERNPVHEDLVAFMCKISPEEIQEKDIQETIQALRDTYTLPEVPSNFREDLLRIFGEEVAPDPTPYYNRWGSWIYQEPPAVDLYSAALHGERAVEEILASFDAWAKRTLSEHMKKHIGGYKLLRSWVQEQVTSAAQGRNLYPKEYILKERLVLRVREHRDWYLKPPRVLRPEDMDEEKPLEFWMEKHLKDLDFWRSQVSDDLLKKAGLPSIETTYKRHKAAMKWLYSLSSQVYFVENTDSVIYGTDFTEAMFNYIHDIHDSASPRVVTLREKISRRTRSFRICTIQGCKYRIENVSSGRTFTVPVNEYHICQRRGNVWTEEGSLVDWR